METTKTHIIRTLPCGCEEMRWVFGREITKSVSTCPEHGFFAPKRRSAHWGGHWPDPDRSKP